MLDKNNQSLQQAKHLGKTCDVHKYVVVENIDDLNLNKYPRITSGIK